MLRHQAIAFALADMKMEIDCARLLVRRASWVGRTGQRFTAAEGSMSKLKAGKVAVWATERAMPLLAALPLLNAGAVVGRWLAGIGLRIGSDLAEMAAGLTTLQDIEARRAFGHTARSVIDISGQRVSAIDKALPGRGGADAARMGQAGPDHPGAPRRPGTRADAGKPA